MTLLAIETSCDETSAAVVRDGRILSNTVSSQVALHAEYGGVVPELAAREHLKNFLPVARAALDAAGIAAGQLDAVAATQGPGLPTALLVGFKAAQAAAFAWRKPFVGVHHHEAHLYSPWIIQRPAPLPMNRVVARASRPFDPRLTGETPVPIRLHPFRGSEREIPFGRILTPSPSSSDGEGVVEDRARGAGTANQFAADFSNFQPNVSLIVSGGHTMLVLVAGELKHRVLGSTIDDAAGECFDKTGKLMGLAYPAGPEIDRLAEQGNPKAFDFPRPLLKDGGDDFSFSGLKTSVRYFLRDHPALLDDAQQVRDLCASIQAAIVEVLVAKTIRAAKRNGVRCVTASGGVTCNRALRHELARACRQNGFVLRLAEQSLCTDNAAMIGILAERKLLAGLPAAALDSEIQPGWALA
jgi:N6-L-threonylcarbamoyladenine synthase